MKTHKTKTFLAIIIPGAISWFVFSSVISGNASNWIASRKFVGGKSGAIEQSKALLDALKRSNWEWNSIPADLKELADVAAAKRVQGPRAAIGSFARQGFSTTDELAFFSDFYVNKKLVVVKGREGDLIESGFYIVGFKNGEVKTFPPDQVRFKYFKGPTGNFGTYVFPGMRHYSESVPLGIMPPDDLVSLPPPHLKRELKL